MQASCYFWDVFGDLAFRVFRVSETLVGQGLGGGLQGFRGLGFRAFWVGGLSAGVSGLQVLG